MPYLKLIKLLYLADRQALLELGRPISCDLFVSMPHGPVLSRTHDLILGEPEQDSYWRRHISAPEDYAVQLIADAPHDQLSPAQETILDGIFQRFGSMGNWALRDHTSTLPECHAPDGSSVPDRSEGHPPGPGRDRG
ncbi:MAG: SocA family protein [Gemmatimonadetes bacterium]|nr:SocA family protein [Gemmatimonadota bacterium]